MIDRLLHLPQNKSFFLFGSRQTGKSTLLKSIFKEETTYFYDLLRSEEYLRLTAHPSLLRTDIISRNQKITHIVLDEIQRIPMLLDEIHSMIESSNAPVFILTGSSARKLKRSKANLLAGRAWTYRLFPLTHLELKDKFDLLKSLQFGTLPKVYLEDNLDDAQQILRAYVETYLKEEIELEAQVRQLGSFIRFLELAAFENGNILNFSNLARGIGTSYQTLKSYFQILEDTLIGFFLFPYAKSSRKRLSKHPKFYFFDLGVTRALMKKLKVPLTPGTPDFGRAFEHFVILELIRLTEYEQLDFSFSYYQTATGAEVDLIIESPQGHTYAIEIKSSNVIASSDLRGLRSFQEICPKAKLCCAALVTRSQKMNDVIILPWQNLMEWIKEM